MTAQTLQVLLAAPALQHAPYRQSKYPEIERHFLNPGTHLCNYT